MISNLTNYVTLRLLIGEHDEAEKTFAIIVGLLAGVALIIIFLTFMRKAFGRNGIKLAPFFLLSKETFL